MGLAAAPTLTLKVLINFGGRYSIMLFTNINKFKQKSKPTEGKGGEGDEGREVVQDQPGG